jgi:hypothetical protein
MAYEPNKDKVLEEEVIGEDAEYKVQLCQYADGEPKVAIVKKVSLPGGEARVGYTNSVGRLRLHAASEIYEALGRILDKAEKFGG